MVLWMLMACQAPFGTQRQDLTGDRIAAISSTVSVDGVRLQVWAVDDGRLWSDEGVEHGWHPLASDELPADDLFLAEPQYTGSSALVEPGTRWAITSVFPSGDRQLSYMDAPLDPSDRPPPVSLRFEAWDHGVIEPETDVSLAAREAQAVLPAEQIAPSYAARLTLQAQGVLPSDTLVRWRITGGETSILELSPLVTDWFAGRLIVDDDEVEEITPAPEQQNTVLALVTDQLTYNSVLLWDVSIGAWPQGFRAQGRWIATDAPVDGYAVQGTIALADTPSGFSLENAVTVPSPSPWPDPPCGPVAAPFDPNALARGECLRGDIGGQQVLMRVDP